MSTALQAPPAASSATPSGRERLRRLRFPLASAAAVLVVAALVAITTPGGSGGDLDPESGAPAGSLAVARILDRQGVEVRRTVDPADTAGEQGTVVLVHPGVLTPTQLASLARQARRLVVVEPDAVTLDALAPSVTPAGPAAPGLAAPGCDLPEAQVGSARSGGLLYTLAQDTPGYACYARAGEDRPRTGSLVLVPDGAAGAPDRDVVVIGQADILTNARLDQDANAALALRLLGSRPTLTWLVPDPLLTGSEEGPGLGSLLPRWVPWVALQACLALILALLWRGRRLGPVVREPLPVAVRGAETLLGRARLYRRARAVDRAAATLRTAVLRRLAVRLAVPPAAGPDAVVVRVAEATGRDPGRVRQVLLGPAPADERALVALADDLDALDREVPGSRLAPYRDPAPGHDPDQQQRDQQQRDQQQRDQQQREGHQR